MAMLAASESLGTTFLARNPSRRELKMKMNWVATTALVDVLNSVDIRKAYPIRAIR